MTRRRKITATEAIAQEYHRIIDDSANDGITRHDAVALATEQVLNLIDAGWSFAPDPTDAIRLAAQKFDEAQGRTADAILGALASGESSSPVPPQEINRTVVTLGGGKRKTWRHVTREDIDLMTEQRKINVRRQQQAIKAWRENAQNIAPIVEQYGTVGDALDASALPLIPA
ncbi:hypothetical protein ACTXKN_12595 [Brachybacterium alimentarium]|uniref:hypothetical protein n=1 Tax=Brachybacterium alimentarium TaxID=47845 RepID=UPI003FD500ED